MHREGAGGSTMSDLLNIIQVGDVSGGGEKAFHTAAERSVVNCVST
jgi:hypothetical protein